MNVEQNEQNEPNELNGLGEPKKTSGSRKSYFLIFTIVIIVFLLGVGYFIHQAIERRMDKINRITASLASDVTRLHKKSNKTQDALQDFKDETTKVDLAEEKIWQPIIIEHLIRMARLCLETKGDVKSALLFLSAAKENTKGPEFVGVSRALSKDISSLQVIPLVDYSSLILRIRALSQRLDVLPMSADKFVKTKKEEKPAAQEKPDAKKLWQRFLVSAKNALKNIVEVRRNGANPLPLPDQEEVLRLNIRMNLLQVEIAVMERRDELYQSCLKEVKIMVKRYFSLNEKGSADIISYIQDLEKIDLDTKLPSLAGSTSAINNFLKNNVKSVSEDKKEGVQATPKKPESNKTRKV